MRISDWSSDVCSSDLLWRPPRRRRGGLPCREDSAGPYRGGVQALQVWREPQRSHSEEYRDRRDYGAEGLLQTRPRYAGRQGRELQLLVFGLTLDSRRQPRSEEHTSELQSLMRISYAVFCLKTKRHQTNNTQHHTY